MKTKRIRALLKEQGYHKKGKEYRKTCDCFSCHGTGTSKGEWVAKGITPNVTTYYEEPGVCSNCGGSGKSKEVTCIPLEKV